MSTQTLDPAVKSFGYAAVHRFLIRVKVNWLRLCLQLILRKKDSVPADAKFWNTVAEIRELIIRKRWLRKRWKIDFENPHTIAEKIEWMKLNYHVPLYVQLSDKVAVRDYVRERLGSRAESVLNRIHGVYDSVKEIDFDDLPDRFVVKTNHGSGGNVICLDKRSFDRSRLDSLELRLRRKFGVDKVEWPYWHIEPKILIEEYLEDQFNQLVDYKVFCFNGKPKFFQVIKNRFNRTTHNPSASHYDVDWNLLPFGSLGWPKLEEEEQFPQPESLYEMIECCYSLSEGLPLVRVDLYDVNGQCRFGEMTMYSDSGVNCRFEPQEWEYTIGSWLTLPPSIYKPKFAFGPII